MSDQVFIKLKHSRTEHQPLGATVRNARTFKRNGVRFKSFKAMNDTIWGCTHMFNTLRHTPAFSLQVT